MTARLSIIQRQATTNMAVIVLCGLLLLNFVQGTTIKGLYCQDPDTGKLYPVNSTWQSETFCGNYTCKLRKKNLTETEYTPITKVNITKTHIENVIRVDDMTTNPSESSFVAVNKFDSTKQPVFHKDVESKINELKEELKNNKSEGDRYLTEAEIKTITEILHTIKKSDLEAIVEIYNIAQEIYKEIESTDDDLVKETINSIKNNQINIKDMPVNKEKSISYWYEPLHRHNTRGKPVDLKIEATNTIPTEFLNIHSSPYYNRPPKEQNLLRSPYYSPVYDFHRMSSYLRSPLNVPEQGLKNTQACKKNMNYATPAWYKPIIQGNTVPYTRPTIQPMLLPYPFSYVNHNNLSYPASYYYSNYPWAQLDVYNRNKNYLQPYYSTYIAPIPNTAIITNAEESVKEQEEQKEIKNKDTSKNNENVWPEWQTEPLSANVLEDIKAHIPESKLLKPLSLKKNVKLEKVGKVVKIDESTKSKREATEDNKEVMKEEYEAYMERTTCTSSTEPGFFRVGNESEPYPACCPQKIPS